jgi:hypothetical protein
MYAHYNAESSKTGVLRAMIDKAAMLGSHEKKIVDVSFLLIIVFLGLFILYRRRECAPRLT